MRKIARKIKRTSFRDALVEELTRDYPMMDIRKGRDKYSFKLSVKKIYFKDGWSFGDFIESISHNRASYSLTGTANGLSIHVKNFTGYLSR